MTVTQEQRAYYEQNGYLIFDSEIPENILDSIVSDLEDKYTSENKLEVSYQDAGRIQDA